MRDKIADNNVLLLMLILILIALNIVSAFMSDSRRPSTIRAELERQGLSVEGVEFEYVGKDESQGWIYESSEPIYYDGEYISQWLLTSRLIGMWPSMQSEDTVTPFLPED